MASRNEKPCDGKRGTGFRMMEILVVTKGASSQGSGVPRVVLISDDAETISFVQHNVEDFVVNFVRAQGIVVSRQAVSEGMSTSAVPG